jgi:hypothetical protein
MPLEELTRRNRYKWNVNEVLNLQREYELHELTIQEIALLHKRSVFSILNKLEKEQIIVNFSDARGYDKVNFWEDNDIEDVDTYDGDDVDDDTDSIGEETKTLHGLRNTTPLDMSCETIDDHENQNDDEIIDNTTDPKFKFESLYFEDEFMKKFNKLTSLKYDNKYRDIFDLIYELEDRVEYLEDKLNSYENSNANTFFTFIKNLFYSKKIC